jgi:hypothetical protein
VALVFHDGGGVEGEGGFGGASITIDLQCKSIVLFLSAGISVFVVYEYAILWVFIVLEEHFLVRQLFTTKVLASVVLIYTHS